MANSTLQPVVFVLLSALLFLSIPVPPLSVQAQSGTPACASNLVPCANYLNSTNPPASCCNPLKEAITNDMQCLCAIYEDPSILKAFNINLTEANQLAGHCGITSATQCNASAPSGTPAPPPPSSGAGERAVWIGVSGLIGLFSIFWSICA